MLFGKLTKYGARLALALIIGLALIGFSPIPAHAAAPVDLVLGGEGATSWNIENIKPGDSGTKTVELHNAGSEYGSVTIWISDIDEVDHSGDGAALDNYLLFNLSCGRLSSSITLPVTIHELPQSASDPNYLKINTLYAGETVTIVWEWEFPETGEPQNDAQGDSLSFSINYLLEELSSGSGDVGTASYQQLEIDILGKVTVATVSSSGILHSSCLATDPDNKHTLEFNRGTRITCADGRIPRRIEMRLCEESLSPPEGMEMVGPAYDLTGYISGSVACPLIFDKPVELTLSYDPDWLPEDALSVLISTYEPENGWAELEPAYGGVAQGNEVTVLISHTSIFAILAKIVPSPSPAPAEFGLSEFAINPAQIEVGEPVTISAIVQNTGELEGSYTLTLTINGEIEQSTEVTLAGGESKQVSFTVVRNKPGTYAVAIDGLTGEFTVLASTSSPGWGSTYWWIILLLVVITVPVVYLLVMRPMRPKNRR
jgi:hypothetical protein